MYYYGVVVFSVLFGVSWSDKLLTFPPGFKFGASTSAYQIEGGWNASDKGESIFDRLYHERPDASMDHSNGEIACDSYHQWRRDIDMIAEMGLHVYRFSISWPRLLPTGFNNYISEAGKNYYNNLIDGLLARNIEPLITIFHFDLPQSIQDLGGWANPLIADWFTDYARVVYTLFGDRVKMWITLNEPMAICDGGYGDFLAPKIVDPDVGLYLCSKNVVLAHAKAWRVYDEEFKPKYHGKVSMTNLFFWYEPVSDEDKETTDLMLEYCEGRFSHPIYSKEGGWPKKLQKLITEQGYEQGYWRPRMPEFTEEEIKFIRGTYDFYALNHYTTNLVKKAKPGEKVGAWPFDGQPIIGANFQKGNGWKTAAPSWFYIYPEGLRHQLNWIRENYGDITIFITENGYAGGSTGLRDQERIDSMRDNLEQTWLAIYEDGIDIRGYITWSLMDNFEWIGGYSVKYGLYEVDFNSTERTRTPRESALYYERVVKTGSVFVHSDEDKHIEL
ncbi:myrosinase 1 [Manduca sexta]|uniref:Myrosinase 1-like n=1 Tax=Manduca sexta TaxID=7130 RepID=A0A922CLQ1_MANSE|nr:myrosinase 1 [Manduca sexta]KAG6451640.1 hypothetical protein O3G_MSEX007261 [Manduca sexta]